MKKKIFAAKITALAVLIIVCFGGCKKNTASLKPIIKFKSISSYDVIQGKALTLTLSIDDITNIAPNLLDTGIAVQFVFMNKISACTFAGAPKVTTTLYAPPDVSGAGTSAAELSFIWDGSSSNRIPGNICRPIDSTQIKVWVRSPTKVCSDTIFVPGLVAIHNN